MNAIIVVYLILNNEEAVPRLPPLPPLPLWSSASSIFVVFSLSPSDELLSTISLDFSFSMVFCSKLTDFASVTARTTRIRRNLNKF